MNAIQKAKSEFLIPNSWWPVPLLNSVQASDLELTVPWVAKCILDVAEHERHRNNALLTNRIQQILAVTSEDELKPFLDEYDRALRDSGDNLMIAYRHMVQAKSFLLTKEIIAFRTQITWSLLFLCDCDYARHTDIEFVVNAFRATFPYCGEET